jgi:hypothetical protein
VLFLVVFALTAQAEDQSFMAITDAELRSNQVPTLGLFCKASSQEKYLTKHLSNFKSAFIGGTHQDAFRRPEFINQLAAFLSVETAKK